MALPLAAEDAPKPVPASTTDVTLAGVAGIEDGDDGRRDDHEGYRNGVLVGIEHRSKGLEIGLRFEPTTAGWLDLTYRPESPFRLELTLDRTRRYSDTSIRPETTPLGTPVSTLYPNTNTLVPAFGDVDPVATRTRFKVRAAWLPSAGVVDFTVRGVDLGGERVPEAQGFAFGDSGAPGFFSPALADLDTQLLEGALGARLRLLCIDWNARIALGKRTSDTVTQTPVWGSTSLLEMYRGAEGHDADYLQAHLTAANQYEHVQLAGGVHYDKVESTPTFSGGALGATPRDVLTSGVSDVTRQGAAGAVSVQPFGGFDVRVTGRIGNEETEASAPRRSRAAPTTSRRPRTSTPGPSAASSATAPAASAPRSLAGARRPPTTSSSPGAPACSSRRTSGRGTLCAASCATRRAPSASPCRADGPGTRRPSSWPTSSTATPRARRNRSSTPSPAPSRASSARPPSP
ncbi:MAG: hypothetical protein IPL90_19475 [Holophagales bacterium]|nr:hypothetical protein [Holophagales bacterium]